MFRRNLLPVVLLLLLPSLAFASLPITEFRQPKPVPASALGADGMPIPERAGALSARNTLVPVGVGAFMCAIFTLGPMAQGDYGAGYALPVVGIGLATAGLVIGPSAGYSYGGIPGRGAVGTLVRLGTLIAPWIVIATISPDGTDGFGALVVLPVVAGLVTVEAVYDVATVKGAVRRHNATLPRPTSLRIEPCLTPSTHAPGLALRANFGRDEGSR